MRRTKLLAYTYCCYLNLVVYVIYTYFRYISYIYATYIFYNYADQSHWVLLLAELLVLPSEDGTHCLLPVLLDPSLFTQYTHWWDSIAEPFADSQEAHPAPLFLRLRDAEELRLYKLWKATQVVVTVQSAPPILVAELLVNIGVAQGPYRLLQKHCPQIH